MLRKRRSLSRGHAPVARGRLGAHKVPPRRHVVVVPSEVEEAVFESTGDPKRDLILAHAHVRRGAGEHPHGRFWIGVAIVGCVLAVFVGWWMTFGFSLSSGSDERSPGLFDVVRQSTKQLKADLQAPAEELNTEMQALKAQQAARAALAKRVAEELRQRQATGTR